MYLDGARIFNASVELGVEPSKLCKYVDAAQFRLTKGLGCPLGFILVGQKNLSKRQKNRQRLGGGMRQAGIIAAPGMYALEKTIDLLKEDNDKARQLAEKLASIEGLFINLNNVQTNIISVAIHYNEMDADKLINDLKEKRIKVKKIGSKKIRMIVHYLITNDQIVYVILTFKGILGGKG